MIEKQRAAKNILNKFRGFLFENCDSLETHSNPKTQKNLLLGYKKSLKNNVRENLPVLDDNDQKRIQVILETVLSKEKENILTSRGDILTSVEAILKRYE
ncbi:MAG: hypothetical protein K1060chlam4_00011 [Candidatus Anoxychlamydiales bacterium]|nr:hypothetical protein [Candidatus Anoxychlamydiales bacterium]